MIPLVKLVSLIVRVFTRPAVNYFKASFKQSKIEAHFWRNTFVGLGQWQHRAYTYMTRRMLNSTQAQIKPLAELKALENGIEFLGEAAVYGTMLGLGFYELNKVTRDSKKKEATQQQAIKDIQQHIESLEVQYFTIYSDLHKLVTEAAETVKRLEADRE